MKEITSEVVNTFLEGHDPMERIITIECEFDDDYAYIVFINDKGEKRIRKEDFMPFVWAKRSIAQKMFDGDRKELKLQMRKYGISVKALQYKQDGERDEDVPERLLNGYTLLFYAQRKMSFQTFMTFFSKAKTPIYPKRSKNDKQKENPRDFLVVSPTEQFMIKSGKRLFKGYDNYDDLKRCQFDLETQGLDPNVHGIDQIGIRTNRGFEKIISVDGIGEERLKNEYKAIEEFLSILAKESPDVIAGHNSENFDWQFIMTRLNVMGTSLEELSLKYFKHPIYKRKKESVLKLGGEVEYFYPTIMWGFNIVDSLHAVRRAQAIDSSMKLANLKYVTRYLNLKKENRVYVIGDKIGDIWRENDNVYAFNDTNGDYYHINDERGVEDGYSLVSGRYIVERYLLDDIWETDKVELALNESNFLIGKLIPTTFQRACTMGTAGLWKLIMLAWSFENDLAVPAFGKSRRFVGGLSRLLRTGFVPRIVKLDYNSLYPSIDLTWWVKTPLDISNIMLFLLEHILTNREKYKELKAKFGALADKIKEQLETVSLTEKDKKKLTEELKYDKAQKSSNDKKQLPLKIFANSFFGSYGSPNIFPFGDDMSAEKTTCIGRMCLRLLISHFTSIGYEPIVGDSFTSDTPLFIKYDESKLIDIKPIEELIGETKTDVLGREYDTSEKPFKVLCRSGWMKPTYIYRHKTNKSIYSVSEDNMNVCVTEDHSLFNDKQEKIKPSEITKDTRLEYYKNNIDYEGNLHPKGFAVKCMAKWLMRGEIDRVPIEILNANKSTKKEFLSYLKGWDYSKTSKTCRAGIQFIKKELAIK